MFKQKKDENSSRVKIFWFEKTHTERSENELEELLQQGWKIVGTGGTGGGGGVWGGFILLTRGLE
jgi:hypothetical protein